MKRRRNSIELIPSSHRATAGRRQVRADYKQADGSQMSHVGREMGAT
ncbi:hypothetical protein [Pleomorphomonas sp. JP5]|nr:hypothetical protein [Pleomorphomonas sp. JP5]MCM5558606.1 hypothetical protein [Pleomorphomonas sp. JP5]